MLAALIQGLAGVRSERPGFDAAWIEPRWKHAGVMEAEVTLSYPATGKELHYNYLYEPEDRRTEIILHGSLVALHIGLPENVESIEAMVDGKKIEVEVGKGEVGKHFEVHREIENELQVRYTEM
jgi:hypothetical protein